VTFDLDRDDSAAAMARSLRCAVSIALGASVLTLSAQCSRPSAKSEEHGMAAPPEVNLSPAAWPAGDLEEYTALNDTYDRPRAVAEGTHGLVSGTFHALAVHAGLEALEQGGTAADAAVTTALAQIAIGGGAGTSYAGSMDILYYDAATRTVHPLNAGFNTVLEETDPLSIPSMPASSGRSAMVPGFMAGMEAMHQRFGRLPWRTLFDPAIYFAATGVTFNSRTAALLDLRKPVLARLPETKQVFTQPNGEWVAAGDLWKQPALAETLRRTAAQGASYMYTGDWGRKLVALVQRDGGKMTMEDLERYEVSWGDPVHVTYHGYDAYAMPEPNIGGGSVLAALNLLELADLRQFGGHYTESPKALAQFIRIMRVPSLSYLPQAAEYFPDLDLSLRSRLGKETAKTLWAHMREPKWARLEQDAYELRQKYSAQMDSWLEGLKPPHTDSVVAADAQGNIAIVEHTLNALYWGTTGIFVDGVSIPDAAAIQQDRVQAAGPGGRIVDDGQPVLVMKDGAPYLASACIGSGGFEATVQTIVNVLDYGMDPQRAVDAPQFMRTPWLAAESNTQTFGEGELPESTLDALRRLGLQVKAVPRSEQGILRGWWGGIRRDPASGRLQGGVTRQLNGLSEGY
jgi:gamma-glutamyltranspeptidase/glutathione hydrolase